MRVLYLIGLACLTLALPGGMAHALPAAAPARAGTAGTDAAVLARITLPGHPAALAVDEQRGRVYVALRGAPPPPSTTGRSPFGVAGSLAVYDARSGRLLRSVPVRLPTNGSVGLFVGQREGRVYAGGDTTTTILNAATMARVATVAGVLDPAAFPVDEHDGHLVTWGAGAQLGPHIVLRLYDAVTGGTVAATPLDTAWEATGIDQRTGHIIAATYVTSPGGVLVLDGKSGRQIAATKLPPARVNGFVADSGPCAMGVDSAAGRAIITASSGGRIVTPVVIIDTRNGARVGMTTQPIEGCLVAVNEPQDAAYLVGGTVNGSYEMHNEPATLFRVSLRTGATQCSVVAGTTPAALAVDAARDHLFLSGQDAAGYGTVRVLDGRSCAVLRTIRTSGVPAKPALDAMRLALDAPRHHLFVLVPDDPIAHSPAALMMLDASAGLPPNRLAAGATPALARP